MVDSPANQPKPRLELADVVRRFGPDYLVPVAQISRKVAALFRDALQAKAPALFATIPATVWQRPWVTFCKHYGQGNEAVLNYLSRYVFRTALSNARLLAMDETPVTFRFQDRKAGTWRTERLEGVAILRRFLQHVLPRGFHKVRYYGLWHPCKRLQSNRAWLLLTLEALADPPEAASTPRMAFSITSCSGWGNWTSNLKACGTPARDRGDSLQSLLGKQAGSAIAIQ